MSVVPFAARSEPLPGDGHAVFVQGEIDVFTAPEFQAVIAEVIDQGARRLLIDLTPTTFVDSSGLSALITAHRRLDSLDGRLAIVNVNANIARTLELTALDELLAVFGERDAALQHLRDAA